MTVAKLMQNGELRVKGIDTRLPLVTDGLVAHYPFDGAGGTFDMIGGNQSLQNTSKDTNLIEAMNLNWRDPSSWQVNSGMSYDSTLDAMKITGYHNTWLKTPIIVNTSMHYEISVDVMETIQSSSGLYLGGYSLDASGIRATTNFDYSIAANDQPATGVWKTYRLTRTGTATASGGSSTSFTTVKGWTGDAGRLIKYYYFGGLFNYSSGGELYIRNLSIKVIDQDTSNTTITNDYVAIEDATTNMLSINNWNNSLSGWSGIFWTSGIRTYESTNLLYSGVNVLKFLISSTASGGPAYLDLSGISTTLGIKYTISVWFKSTSRICRTYGHDTANAGSVQGNNIIPNGEWQKSSYTFTTVSTTGKMRIHLLAESGNVNDVIYVTAPQVEQKSFATEYVNGSRSASGKFTVLNPVKTGEFTISYDWKSNSPVGTSSSYQTSFSMGTYYTNNSFTIMDTNSASTGGTQRLIRKGNAGEWAWIDANLTETASFQDWTTITIVRNATYYRAYSNGIYKGQIAHSSATMQDYIHVGSRESWRAGENSSIRNLSIYNRALSDSEVTKISKGTHSFTQDGLITKSINTTGEIRYIRDYLNGSTANTGNHWIEIKANTQDGTNVALGKIPTSNSTLTSGSVITDGNVNTTYSSSGAGLSYVQIDLGAMYLIDNIQVWHYYPDLRTYYSTRTQVSHDGVKWYDVFNSANDGTYQESVNGITHYVGGSGSSAMSAKVSGLTMNGINSTATL